MKLLFLSIVLLHGFCAAAWCQLPAFSDAAMVSWWKTHPPGTDWKAEKILLSRQLVAEQEKLGLEKAAASESFMGWLQLAVWLDCLPEDGAGWLASEEGEKAFITAGANATIRKYFLGYLSPFDDAAKACEILCHTLQLHPERVLKLPQVAVAIALVFDQPFPDNWPHPWVAKNQLAIGDEDPVRRFLWFAVANEKRKFLMDPSRMTVRDLMFVVDTPLAFTELEYVLQVNLKQPSRLAELFPRVAYDFKRMDEGALMWPHGSYRLIDVGKAGGICADQAFFVSQTGKAQGIPSVMLVGQGNSGGHAWVGYMGAPGTWTLDVARYEEGNFVAGSAWDPQTWRRVTDAQLRFLFKEPATGAHVLRGRLLARWALMNKEAEFYPQLLGLARSVWPRSVDIWEMQAACLKEKSIAESACKVFWGQWITTFQADPDMRVRGQMNLLELLQKEGDSTGAQKLREKITAENKSKRFDLAIVLAVGPVFELAAVGRWDEADKEYARVLKQFEQQAGGDLFYNLVQPYVERSLHAGRKAQAQAAFQAARPIFKITKSSTMEVDMKALGNMLN